MELQVWRPLSAGSLRGKRLIQPDGLDWFLVPPIVGSTYYDYYYLYIVVMTIILITIIVYNNKNNNDNNDNNNSNNNDNDNTMSHNVTHTHTPAEAFLRVFTPQIGSKWMISQRILSPTF